MAHRDRQRPHIVGFNLLELKGYLDSLVKRTPLEIVAMQRSFRMRTHVYFTGRRAVVLDTLFLECVLLGSQAITQWGHSQSHRHWLVLQHFVRHRYRNEIKIKAPFSKTYARQSCKSGTHFRELAESLKGVLSADGWRYLSFLASGRPFFVSEDSHVAVQKESAPDTTTALQHGHGDIKVEAAFNVIEDESGDGDGHGIKVASDGNVSDSTNQLKDVVDNSDDDDEEGEQDSYKYIRASCLGFPGEGSQYNDRIPLLSSNNDAYDGKLFDDGGRFSCAYLRLEEARRLYQDMKPVAEAIGRSEEKDVRGGVQEKTNLGFYKLSDGSLLQEHLVSLVPNLVSLLRRITGDGLDLFISLEFRRRFKRAMPPTQQLSDVALV